MKRLVAFAFALVLAVGVYSQIPQMTLKTINGKTVNTAEYLQNDGKPFILSFFATWCKPCQRELDAINDKIVDWEEETGVKVFIVSIDEGQNVNKVKPLVDGKGWEFDCLLDPNSDLKRALNIPAIPFVFVIDGEGNIAYQHQGYSDGSEEHLIETVRELLK